MGPENSVNGPENHCKQSCKWSSEKPCNSPKTPVKSPETPLRSSTLLNSPKNPKQFRKPMNPNM